MKMVAAAKFRRAEEKVEHAKRFMSRIDAILERLSPVMGQVAHPFISSGGQTENNRVLLVLLTSDKGLCGSFNSNLVKKALEHANGLTAAGRSVELFAVGKKGRDFFRRRGFKIWQYEQNPRRGPGWGMVRTIERQISAAFKAGEFAEVHVVYSDFVNVTKHIPTAVKLLPVEPPDPNTVSAPEFENVILEPKSEELVRHTLDRYLGIEILCALHVNYASENGARMVAMDNATTAAGDMIDALTLEYNKARQAAITKELLDIVGGAEAMKV